MTQQKNIHNEPLVILDIRGLLLRGYNVISGGERIADEDGTLIPTGNNAVAHAMVELFEPLFAQYAPRRVICCWDGGNDYRLNLFRDYKKIRRSRDQGSSKILKQQQKLMFEGIKKVTAYLGVRHFNVAGQEADDLITLFCRQMPERPLLVKTVDGDLVQLAGDYPNVSVWLAGSQETYGTPPPGMEGVVQTEHKGVPCKFVRLFKSIVGDTSDSYPGVPGLGEKKFFELAQDFGWDGMEQLEQCVKTEDYSVLEQAVAALPGNAILQKLNGHRPEWKLSYELALFHPEVCYGTRQGKVVKPVLYTRLPLADKFTQSLTEVGAADLLPRFTKWLSSEALLDVHNHERLRALAPGIAESPLVAYDFESHDPLKHEPFQQAAKAGGGRFVDVLSQRLDGLSFCIGDNLQYSYYVPIGHANTDNLNDQWAMWCLDVFSMHPAPVVQNASFEVSVALTSLNHAVASPLDTAITASYVDENELSGLKDRAMKVFRYKQTSYDEVTQGRDMNELSGAEVLSYGCDDSLVSAHLLDTDRLIMQLEGTWEFYLNEEVEPIQDDVRNFIDGTCLDLDLLRKVEAEDAETVRESTAKVRKALEAHCTAPTQETLQVVAKRLLDEWWYVEGLKLNAKLQAGEINQEALNESYQRAWEKFWAACIYTPYHEKVNDIDFSPTPKNLSQVAELLGAQPIEKNSKRGLNDWLHDNDDVLMTTAHGRRFVDTLSAAAGSLSQKKNRNGEAYQNFHDLCVTVLRELGGLEGAKETFGTELNFGSGPQMQAMLYGMLQLPIRRRSKVDKGTFRDKHDLKGGPATGKKAISSALVYDVVEQEDWRMEVLQEYKKITTCIQANSLYYSKYPLWIHPRDGRIHPQIKNCGTVTRRPAGTAPNVLQVSKKDGAKVRKVYIPPNKDYAYVCLDFAGQELRITASESRDPTMLDAYLGENKKDIHSLTAAGIAHILLPRNEEGFRLPQFSQPMDYETYLAGRKEGEHTKAFNKVRGDFAKAVNFLIIYVGSAHTLAENLNIPIDLAEAIMANTFRLYDRLQPWQQEVIEFARTWGYVQTAYGNRRHISDDILSSDGGLRSRAERQAVNMLAQGCAADILKKVRQEMRSRNMRERYHLQSVMPIYDEMAACVPIEAIPEYVMEMKEVMEVTPPGHAVPMVMEAEIGLKSWGDKKEVPELTPEGIAEWLRQQKEEAAEAEQEEAA